jgi:L-amino acid N-acyltransferase YncA
MNAAERNRLNIKLENSSCLFIRKAEEHDLPAMIQIFDYHVLNSQNILEDEKDSAMERCAPWLLEQSENGLGSYVIVEIDGQRKEVRLIGFASCTYQNHADGKFAVELSLYLDRDQCHNCVGKLVTRFLGTEVRKKGFQSLIINPWRENHAIINFSNPQGFNVVEKLKGLGTTISRMLDARVLHKAS